VFAALTRPGDWIAAEHLTYPGIKAIASQLELRVAGLAMEREGLLPEALDRLCTREKIRILYTIPTLQNPTGALMSEDRRETIADIARRRNIVIVEDDIYAFLVESPPPPMAAFAPERSYLVTGLSKGVFPGLRLGFAVTPPGGRDAVAGMVRMSLITVSPLAAAIGTSWLENRTADRIAEWKRMEIEWRWQMASRFFGLDTHDAHFAAHLWLPLTQDPEQFVSRVRAKGVVLAAANVFSVSAESVPSAVRICLGVPATRARLQQALEVIAEVLDGRPALAPFI